MATKKDPWFVIERSEALAGLLLTNRDDVSVQKRVRSDSGVDFMVDVGSGDLKSSQFFVVQVKGTTSSNPSEWMRDVKQLFPTPGVQVYLPTCVFLINVKDNKAFYAWAAKPTVEGRSAKLQFYERGNFSPLDEAAVDTIVDEVEAYYRAIAKILAPA